MKNMQTQEVSAKLAHVLCFEKCALCFSNSRIKNTDHGNCMKDVYLMSEICMVTCCKHKHLVS